MAATNQSFTLQGRIKCSGYDIALHCPRSYEEGFLTFSPIEDSNGSVWRCYYKANRNKDRREICQLTTSNIKCSWENFRGPQKKKSITFDLRNGDKLNFVTETLCELTNMEKLSKLLKMLQSGTGNGAIKLSTPYKYGGINGTNQSKSFQRSYSQSTRNTFNDYGGQKTTFPQTPNISPIHRQNSGFSKYGDENKNFTYSSPCGKNNKIINCNPNRKDDDISHEKTMETPDHKTPFGSSVNLYSPNGDKTPSARFYGGKPGDLSSLRGQRIFEGNRIDATPNGSNVRKRLHVLNDSPPKRIKTSDACEQTNSEVEMSLTEVEKNKPKLYGEGFTNLGNTCYMNAVLQSLFSLDCFTAEVLQLYKLLRQNTSQNNLLIHLAELFLVRGVPEKSESGLKKIKQAIASVSETFIGNSMQDAHELLLTLLDKVNEDIMNVQKNSEDDNSDSVHFTTNPVRDSFEFELATTYSCRKCEKSISKNEVYFYLSVNLPNMQLTSSPSSLQDALDLYFQPESMEYACGTCQCKESRVTTQFARLPKVLIIHLKRYMYNQSSQKDTHPVSIPRYLTLQKLVTPNIRQPLTVQQPSLLLLRNREKDINLNTDPPSQAEAEMTQPDINRNSNSLLCNETIDCPEVCGIGLQGGQGPLSEQSLVPTCENAPETATEEKDETIDLTEDQQLKEALAKSLEEHEQQQYKEAQLLSLTENTTKSEKNSEISACSLLKRDEEECKLLNKNAECGFLDHSYRLVSSVNHIGSLTSSGHYVCDAYDFSRKKWLQYDDSDVEETNEEKLRSTREKTTYILCYVQKDVWDQLEKPSFGDDECSSGSER